MGATVLALELQRQAGLPEMELRLRRDLVEPLVGTDEESGVCRGALGSASYWWRAGPMSCSSPTGTRAGRRSPPPSTPRRAAADAASGSASRAPRRPRCRAPTAGWLGDLLAYDAARGAALVDTLSRHLEHRGSYDAAAAALNVHRSTLKYRLKRIAEVSGHDLAVPDTAFTSSSPRTPPDDGGAARGMSDPWSG